MRRWLCSVTCRVCVLCVCPVCQVLCVAYALLCGVCVECVVVHVCVSCSLFVLCVVDDVLRVSCVRGAESPSITDPIFPTNFFVVVDIILWCPSIR